MILLFIAVFIIALYFYNTRTFHYWKNRGIKYEEPLLFFGTYKKTYLAQQSRSQLIDEIYWKYPNEKLVGGFKSTTPELVVKDPDMIKSVLVSDFSSFHFRGINNVRESYEALRQHLFAVEGDLWRMLRQRMTPAFTSGKLKAMFPLIVERTEKLQLRTLSAAKSNSPIDARELMARYTTDFIGACGFGVDSDSLNDEDSEFRKMGKKMFSFTYMDAIILSLKDVFPKLFAKVKVFRKVEGDVLGLVERIKKERNYTPCGRHDFVDILLEYYKKPMETESIEKSNPDGSPMKVSCIFDDDLFAAQVFVFFGAGFETSASSTSYTLHQLAYNPEVQKKLQEEIDQVLARHQNKLSYQAVKEMTYLEWTFKEGLRMFPSLGFLMRKSTKKYTFEDVNVTIDKGVNIIIPVQSMHMDPQYWDNPKEFRPERFNPENFNSKQKTVYFPFGEGPRNCIGSRLGLMQSMAGLAAILAKFTVEPGPTTLRDPMVEPRSNVVQSIRNGLPLLFKVRENVS